MNGTWTGSLDQIWQSLAFPTGLTFPLWLTLAAAGLFGIVTLMALLRADKSVANGALTVITLLAIGVAMASAVRESSSATSTAGPITVAESQPAPQPGAASPAMSCVDEMAGDAVLAACEKVLFGSADSVAAAVSYTAARISRLTALGDVAAADRAMTPDLQALRHSIERDRYGLAAYVLLTREHCTPTDCSAFRSLTDHNQIVANMDERAYENLITRYAASWNAPPAAVAAATTAALGPLAGLGASVPTGKPTNAEFPSAASTPAVSIMSPEPGTSATASRAPAAASASAAPSPPPARPAPHPAAAAPAPAPTVAAAPRRAAPKPRVVAAPVQLAPAAPAAPAEPAPAPAASND